METKNEAAKVADGPRVVCFVSSEQELNQVIENANNGRITNPIIHVKSSFTLTADPVSVSADLSFTGAEGAVLDNGGFNITLRNGASVPFSLKTTGNGAVNVNGDGANTTLIGMSGGEVGLLNIYNDGRLLVESDQEFGTGAVSIYPGDGIAAGFTIDGILRNSGLITATQGLIGNRENSSPSIGDTKFVNESFLKIWPGTVFEVASLHLSMINWVTSDGTGTLHCPGELVIEGDPQGIHTPGNITGVNVKGTVQLKKNGLFTGFQVNGHSATGQSADAVQNDGGILDIGVKGNWLIGTYTQTGTGVLNIGLPDFLGNAPLLSVAGNADFNGGKITVNAGIYFLPPGTTNQKIKVITAGKLNLPDPGIIVFQNFPEGLTASASIEENDVYVVLTVTPS